MAIAIEGELISGFESDPTGADGGHMLAGFIDVHNHGAAGIDVNEADVGGLLRVGEFLARHGVTSWVPTLVPDADDVYRRVVDAINETMELQVGRPIAQIVGVHYEGVFANEHMCGALRPQYFKSRRLAEGGWRLPKLDRGVHLTTLAPEVDRGIDLITQLVEDGWVVAIGHTRATPDVLDAAFEAGARHLTHFFNAMTGIHHRDLGVAGWGLTRPEVTFDIIADGRHVHPDMLSMACRAKGVNGVSLISDSIAPTGLGDGDYSLWGETIRVENAQTKNARGGIAGSVITMLDAVKFMLKLGFPHEEVGQMAATNPAKLLGLENERGSLEVGMRADLVSLGADGNIERVLIGGQGVTLN